MAEPGLLEAGVGAGRGLGCPGGGDNTLDLITSNFLIPPVLKLHFK